MNWLQHIANRPRMEPEGDGSLGILFMGEALGEHEEADKLPFRPWAEAGSLLQRALNRAGIPREHLTLSNMVWYRPPDNKLSGMGWEREAIAHSWPLNQELIERTKPKALVALGGIAFRELSGLSGPRLGISSARGFIVPSVVGIPVVGTYHPSYIRRGSKQKGDSGARTETPGGGTLGMALLGVLIRDLKLGLEISQNGYQSFIAAEYILDATLDDWRKLLAETIFHPEWLLSYDLETNWSIIEEDETEGEVRLVEPTQFQISVRPGHALVSRWSSDLWEIIKAFLALPNPKLDWNGRKFDRPLIRDLGGRTDIGIWHDGMDLWHHAQPDIQRGLQFAASFACPEVGPWKHLSYSNPFLYGAYDVDMPQRIWAYLEKSMGQLRHQASSVSLWEGYRDQVARLSPTLDRMGQRGIPVDDERRIALGEEYDRTLEGIEAQATEVAPWQIRPLHPKGGYKKTPPGLINPFDISDDARALRAHYDERALREGEEYLFKHFRARGEEWARWAKLLPFNIGSASQIKDYLKFKGYKIPHHPKTDQETTDALALHKVLKQHPDPLLEMRLEYMGIKKAKTAYVEGWKPGPDGRVHPMFGFKPATGQMSSEGPNAQNFPKHGKLAKAMRRMIRARPGHKFVSFDYKSFHVLTTGFEAGDPSYMRLARLDMHSFFALTGLLKLEPPEKLLELPDLGLMEKLAWYRKNTKIYPQYATSGHPGGMTFGEIRDEQAKRTILGAGFGLSGRGMFKRNPDSFSSVKQAEAVKQMLIELFPLEEKWRHAVRLEADRYANLLTRYGYVRWFWDVFSRQLAPPNYRGGRPTLVDEKGREWLIGPGDDHEASVAYRPANDAFGIKRAGMVWLGEEGLDEKYGLIDEIHDDLTFEPPINFIDEMIPIVKGKMEEPSPYLVSEVAPDGLWCEVEVSIGDSFAEMEKIKA